MRKVVFISYLDDNYSRSAVLMSALKKDSHCLVEYFRVKSLKLPHLNEFMKYLRDLEVGKTIVVIMSPAHLLTIFARLSFKGSLILDAGWPLSDSSKVRKGNLTFAFFKDSVIDRLAMLLADKVIVESNGQKANLIQRGFKFKSDPKVIYSGLLERRFKFALGKVNELTKKSFSGKNKLKILFRGKYNSESGLDYIQDIFASRSSFCELIICCPNLPNSFPRIPGVKYLTEQFSDTQLTRVFKDADLALGQFGEDSRVKFSIAHKIFEYSYFGLPTICIKGTAVEEIFESDEFYFVRREDLGRFLDKSLKNKKSFAKDIGKRSVRVREKYSKACSEKVIAQDFIQIAKAI